MAYALRCCAKAPKRRFAMRQHPWGVVAAILLITTLQTDAEGLGDVMNWFIAAGGRAPKVRVVERDNARFIVAASRIKAGEVVISTPQKMILDEHRARNHPDLKPILDGYDAVQADVSVLPVMIALLREVYKRDGSSWAKYIQYLPQRHLDVLTMSEDEAKAASVHKVWFEHMTMLQSVFRALQMVCQEHPAVFGKGNCPDLLMTRWAMSTVWTRAFKGRERHHRGDLALIPLADALNHAHASSSSKPLEHHWCNLTEDELPPQASPFASDSPLSYCLTARSDYEAGEELFIDYGLDCNSQVLATYGFVALDGHHDCATFHLAHSAAKLCWEKVKAIKAFNLLNDVRLYAEHIPPASVGDFFHLVALPTCDSSEIEKSMQYSSNVTVEQDLAARREWIQSLRVVKAHLLKRVKRGPWDTRKHDGLVQQLRQSELRAVDWHIRFAEGSKTLADRASPAAEQWFERCLDRDAKCQAWATEGECARNGTWMQQACCHACKEEDRRANKCHETLRAANMQTTSVASFSESSPPACTDSAKYKAKCAVFARVGGCAKQKAFMAKFCCATCLEVESKSSAAAKVAGG